MKFCSSSSILVLSSSAVVGVRGQFAGFDSGFQGSIQPIGVATVPPVVTPTPTAIVTEPSLPTAPPSETPTVTPEPTDFPTVTPTVNNDEVCIDLDDDWEEWYQEYTEADHTCQCEPAVEGMAENRVRMNCFGEELYCCAATGTCYETDDTTEHVITDRLDGGVVDLSIWRSCTNVYLGGVDNPVQTHTICHEFAYAPRSAVARQSADPPLGGCRVTINDQLCNSCTPCEQNGPAMSGYDCTNIPGIDQIPPEVLPMGPQTECHLLDFPECTFNGGFVDVDLSELREESESSSLTLWTSHSLLLAAVALFLH